MFRLCGGKVEPELGGENLETYDGDQNGDPDNFDEVPIGGDEKRVVIVEQIGRTNQEL